MYDDDDNIVLLPGCPTGGEDPAEEEPDDVEFVFPIIDDPGYFRQRPGKRFDLPTPTPFNGYTTPKTPLLLRDAGNYDFPALPDFSRYIIPKKELPAWVYALIVAALTTLFFVFVRF